MSTLWILAASTVRTGVDSLGMFVATRLNLSGKLDMKYGVAVVPKRVRTACEKCANWTLLADGKSKNPVVLRSFSCSPSSKSYLLIDK